MIEQDEEKEEWRIIPKNENYEISNLAQIRNKKTKKIRKKKITTDGYEVICLYLQNGRRKTHQVHRLVALTFILNPNNFPQVNHKDRNKANNRVENLEWVNGSMNMKHCIKTGAKRHKRAVRQCDLEGKFIKEFDSLIEGAKSVGCTPANISACINGKQNTAAGFIWEFIEEIKEEPQKDIPSMEIKDYPYYRIYNNGQVYTEKRNHYLTPTISNGYYRVGLYNTNGIQRNHQVHKLVAQYFCENPDNKPVVNHKDGNKLNNHYTNLEWVTRSENTKHAHSLGLNKRVKRVHQYAREDKEKLKPLHTFNSLREAAEFVKPKSRGVISTIIKKISMACTGVYNTAYGYKWGYGEILYDYLQKTK